MKEIKITEDILNEIHEMRGTVFKEFLRLGEGMEGDAIFEIFVRNSLKDTGIEVQDAFEQLSFNDFALVLGRVMELNNMDELFRAIERLNRGTSKAQSN